MRLVTDSTNQYLAGDEWAFEYRVRRRWQSGRHGDYSPDCAELLLKGYKSSVQRGATTFGPWFLVNDACLVCILLGI